MRKQFHQENNRLEYGSLLYPMPGFRLSFAVGTTYSLDLEALLSVPVSFGVMESPDAETLHNPFVVLEAIRRCSDQLALFCNVDGIKLPQEIRSVYSLLENSVFTVNVGASANFHPKMWVIRYENGAGEKKIRLIILSRNLTFDRSMDVAVEMTGKIEPGRKRLQKKHQPIRDLLIFLAGYTDSKTKKHEILSLAQDIMLVNKFDIDDQYEDYRFLPVGFPGYEKKAKDFFSDASAMLIVSPFLSKTVIEEMTKVTDTSTLISRISSVTLEIYRMFDEVYVPIAGLENDNPLEEGEPDEAPKRDLHAKVVYKECASGNYLYLGSLNATANAFYHNVEIMLELKFRPYIASLKQMKADFVEDKNSAFQLLSHEPDEAVSGEAEEMTDFSDVAEAFTGAKVFWEDNHFCVEVYAGTYNGGAEIRPLFGKGAYKKLTSITRFERMTVKELSEFYAVRKDGQKRVLKIVTEGIPSEERDKAIFNSIIDSKPKFFQYILFLLADDPAMAIVENDEYLRGVHGEDYRSSQAISPAIYEKLLLTAAREPDRLKAVKDVLARVDQEHLDHEFENMLNVFIKTVEGR